MKTYICYQNYKMNKSIFYILLGISLFFTSCIPTKDLIYLQNKSGTGSSHIGGYAETVSTAGQRCFEHHHQGR
jgi:hypothetical protein